MNLAEIDRQRARIKALHPGRAGQNAVETGNTYAVVGLDDDVWECHMPHAVPESWIDSDEYRAFDGRLSLHHPDGTSEEY